MPESVSCSASRSRLRHQPRSPPGTQSTSLALGIRRACEQEEQVGEAVEVLQRGRARPARRRPARPSRARRAGRRCARGAARRRRGRAAGEHERGQRRQPLVDLVAALLEPGDLLGRDAQARALARRLPVRALLLGHAEVGAEVEEVVLDAAEPGVHAARAADACAPGRARLRARRRCRTRRCAEPPSTRAGRRRGWSPRRRRRGCRCGRAARRRSVTDLAYAKRLQPHAAELVAQRERRRACCAWPAALTRERAAGLDLAGGATAPRPRRMRQTALRVGDGCP